VNYVYFVIFDTLDTPVRPCNYKKIFRNSSRDEGLHEMCQSDLSGGAPGSSAEYRTSK